MLKITNEFQLNLYFSVKRLCVEYNINSVNLSQCIMRNFESKFNSKHNIYVIFNLPGFCLRTLPSLIHLLEKQ